MILLPTDSLRSPEVRLLEYHMAHSRNICRLHQYGVLESPVAYTICNRDASVCMHSCNIAVLVIATIVTTIEDIPVTVGSALVGATATLLRIIC